MRQKAEAEGSDLLVIDTGDRIEGNGLYDTSEPKGVYTSKIFKQQHIDVLSSGNHELYKQNSSEREYLVTVPNFHGNYLASNIDIIDPDTGDLVPLAPRFKKFTTKKQGIRIVAFGFLFDFNGNYNNTAVKKVEDTVKEDWFQEAIRDKDVDLFLVAGHVPVHSKEYETIFKEIRTIKWDTPIQFFGGHFHIRDYAKYDAKAYGLASGRFMETIGFMSISGLSTKKQKKGHDAGSTALSFNRRYIDNNLLSYYHHTGLNESTFPTSDGKEVSDMIEQARRELKLDRLYGCAPDNFWMSRAPYPDENSIFTWLEKKVIPETLNEKARSSKPAMAIINTGAIRFDLFKGPFTQDTAYILSPFVSGFRYTKGVPYDKATKILEILNKQEKVLSEQLASSPFQTSFLAPPEQLGRPEYIIPQAYDGFAHSGDQIPFTDKDPDLIPGYTTKDDAGTDGDDTVHSPLSFYNVPNCIQSFIPVRNPSLPIKHHSAGTNIDAVPETVDLVYLDFIEPWIDVAAKFAGLDFDINTDTDVYMDGATLTTLILEWVQKNWACDGGSGADYNL